MHRETQQGGAKEKKKSECVRGTEGARAQLNGAARASDSTSKCCGLRAEKKIS